MQGYPNFSQKGPNLIMWRSRRPAFPSDIFYFFSCFCKLATASRECERPLGQLSTVHSFRLGFEAAAFLCNCFVLIFSLSFLSISKHSAGNVWSRGKPPSLQHRSRLWQAHITQSETKAGDHVKCAPGRTLAQWKGIVFWKGTAVISHTDASMNQKHA